ncbi:SRPBCC family protein [Polaromonas sp. JS666]|uniref:SRPBCC family protein n=1 Tax=Polaromonas sp. (strain JS666 / ATCC BAA-500) TaxID=296591 RepID=UPI0008819A07|nr:SRPBCC family protein [Polaromonas sp. JS666]SDO07570.1 Polyketide cyclase / dehydrase and lipid transport [Polaromonas sp. JS666]
MFKTIAIIAAVLVLLFVVTVLVLASGKPDTFRVQRQASIQAPPEKIFPLINDYKNWGAWSPWEKKDPAMKRSFSGPAAGKGAAYAWDSKEVGVGDMLITESQPSSLVKIDLNFSKPFEAHNKVVFSIQPQAGGSSTVSWEMAGPAPLMARVMHVFFDMDKMVGKDFEAGLAAMKAAAEKQG